LRAQKPIASAVESAQATFEEETIRILSGSFEGHVSQEGVFDLWRSEKCKFWECEKLTF